MITFETFNVKSDITFWANGLWIFTTGRTTTLSWIVTWIMSDTVKTNFRRHSFLIRFNSKQCNFGKREDMTLLSRWIFDSINTHNFSLSWLDVDRYKTQVFLTVASVKKMKKGFHHFLDRKLYDTKKYFDPSCWLHYLSFHLTAITLLAESHL